MLADRLVHQRLRGGRFVGLVVTVAAIADEIDEDVLVESLAVLERQARRETAASGSSPFTWKTGASIIFATSEQYGVERASGGSLVVKPIWLLMMMCTVPPL
jgi:hypothetical protein